MVTISVTSDVSAVARRISERHKRQVPFAASRALNVLAGKVASRENSEIVSIFDRPTPRTVKAVKVFKGATKGDLSVVIGVDDGFRRTAADAALGTKGKNAVPPSAYLLAQIIGGHRVPKRFELALQRVGAMPPGKMAVFAKRSNALDAYGNITQAKIVQILSWFQAFPESGYRANMKDRTKQSLMKGQRKGMQHGFAYFSGGGKTDLPDGIWERHFPNGTAGKSFVRPILIFIDPAQYRARFKFQEIGAQVVAREWSPAFAAALADAVRTAK
ncbi:MAG: hypothetical protein H6R10_715 [Rhodocyclaceae bacterium]|nr:hypothetical protein [Rhodocyclaceae bacterium]